MNSLPIRIYHWQNIDIKIVEDTIAGVFILNEFSDCIEHWSWADPFPCMDAAINPKKMDLEKL